MKRREFLNTAGLAAGAGAAALAPFLVQAGEPAKMDITPGDWAALRDAFPLTPDFVHLATFLLASHPEPVASAIEQHRRGLDENPADYWHEQFRTIDGKVSRAAADYMGGEGSQVALTDSTTMGLGLVYGGLVLKPGDEILQTVHDHYSTDMSLANRAALSGNPVRRIALYDEPSQTSVTQCTERLAQAIRPETRVVAVTWVHSSTGVKLPVHALGEVIEQANRNRSEKEKILFCIDGVHGFGIENQDVSKLGCDFFIAGTHKWIFGPRGTGVIWGSERGWSRCKPIIPSFSASYDVWLGNTTQDQVPVGEHMSPGGFHSFEHRWALPTAFELHRKLGKERVQARIHELNTQTKDGLAAMPHVTLYTPRSTELSSGLVCFDVDGVHAQKVVARLHAEGVVMSNTPYRDTHARFAPSLLNNEQEIDRALAEIDALKHG